MSRESHYTCKNIYSTKNDFAKISLEYYSIMSNYMSYKG